MAVIPPSVALSGSSGDVRLDEVLRDLAGLLELSLPGRIAALYLVGSHATGDALPESDVDLALVFRGAMTADDEPRARLVRRYASSLSGTFLDVGFFAEEALLRAGDRALAEASVLLFGEDLRDRLPEPRPELEARRAMHAPLLFSRRLRHAAILAPPLAAPDPDAPFLGYELVTWAPEGHPYRHTLRDFVALVGQLASARIAWLGGATVTKKTALPERYRRLVGDEWTSLVEFAVGTARTRWRYAIPDTAPERELLRAMAERALAFENLHYAAYHDFLIAELERVGQRPALLERLREVDYGSGALEEARALALARAGSGAC